MASVWSDGVKAWYEMENKYNQMVAKKLKHLFDTNNNSIPAFLFHRFVVSELR